MKAIKTLNTIALCIPIFLALFAIFERGLLALALLSTMITGLIQVILAFKYWQENPKDVFIKIYFFGVVLFFFLLCFFNENWIWYLPPILCVYLSLLIYKSEIIKTSFLTASWNNLCLFNYETDAKPLEKYLPKGTVIDFWNNKCYVSLVGFMFNNTKVLGIKIPFHINFEEVNLRFYVKRLENGEWKRGVVFIKEIVPKQAITFIANTLYNEHYHTTKMKHSVVENIKSKTFVYQWQNENQWNSIQLETKLNPVEIEINSEAEFITEHYFGYTKNDEKTTFEYEVTHPRWKQLEIINYKIDVDFEKNYGKDFAFLNGLKPVSVFLAKGSKITVENKRKIKL